MSITIKGLGSGLDYATWIDQLVGVQQQKIDKVVAQQSQVNTEKTAMTTVKNNYQSLYDTIQNFKDTVVAKDVFAQKTATSSSDAVTATVTAYSTAQNINVNVRQLATSTVAKSVGTVAAFVDNNTKLSEIAEGAIKDGSFSVYVNNQKYTIDVTSETTVGNVLDALNDIEGVDATLTDGKLKIQGENHATVSVGSSADTTNFTDVFSLVRDTATGVYSSSKSVFATSVSKPLVSTNFASGQVTEGTFKIGSKEFTIDSSTTMESLVASINKGGAGVTAYWDKNSGQFSLTSTTEGAVNINIEAGSSNFTDIMGLTVTEGGTSKLADGSQTLGTNAVLTINGTEITSASNTVNSDVTGITGLTLKLNNTTSSTAKVTIGADTSKAEEAILKFVNSFNTAIENTDIATASETGTLHGETLLVSLRNIVRQGVTAKSDATGPYKSLADIGITTGAFSVDTSKATNKLEIDTEKLKKALAEDPEAVRELFVGSKNTGAKGLTSKFEGTLESYLDPVKGYFSTRIKSYDREISDYDKKISTMERKLTDYQAQLEAKFQAMDELISKLQNQSSVFDSYFNKKTDDKK